MKNDEDIQIIILLDSIGTKIRIKVTQMHRSDRTISERLSLGRGLPLFGKLESRTVSFEERRVSEVSLRQDDYLLVVEETSYVKPKIAFCSDSIKQFLLYESLGIDIRVGTEPSGQLECNSVMI